ncbi:MAG: hypothetical protein V2B15_05535 [Bacteroidota bacterium]
MNKHSLRPLAITFVLSGIWDSIAALQYFFFIGTGRHLDNPPVHSFYTVFLGSFFLCFAYLQFMSARNIRRYAFNVGCLFIGRLFYVIELYAYMGFVEEFPSTFWFTGIIDGLFTILYPVFAMKGGLRMRDLFLPGTESI